MSELKVAEKIAQSDTVFLILFIILLFAVGKWIRDYINEVKQENEKREQEIKDLYQEHKKESKEREQALMKHLDKSNDAQERTSKTLEQIETGLHSLGRQVDEGFRDVWRKFKKIDQ